MNTIMITGKAQTVGTATKHGVEFSVKYSLIIWGSRTGEAIQYIESYDNELPNYSSLWIRAKIVAENYFKDHQFGDGAYTQFLDHIVSC